MKRRDFLKHSAIASSTLFVPSFINATNTILTPNTGYKRVIVIQLSGGNDGLNTIIPIANDFYYKARPKLAISKNDTLKINNTVGFNKSLLPLQGLYDNGQLCIINNVGYPNPNRSHFRSTDIWQTASDSNQFLQHGWIGRYLDNNAKHTYNAIELDEKLSLIMKGKYLNGIATKDPKILFNSSNDPFFKLLLNDHNNQHLSEHNLGYLYKSLVDAKSSAKYIHEKNTIKNSSQEYPNHYFGRQLKTTANLINSNIDTKIFYTSLDGFDTHANQLNTQARLLDIYSKSIEALVKDLKSNNTFNDTLILTFSEFGRRVSENRGRGTDHGAANALFVIGNKLKKPGFYNDLASLSDLDENGDIKYKIDFRQVYATVLKKWLNVDDKAILNKSFDYLDFI